MKSIDSLKIENTTQIEDKYKITTIPDSEKALNYIYSNFGSKVGESITNFGREDNKQSVRSVTSMYWRYYAQLYPNFKRSHLKVVNHPDVTEEDYIYLSNHMRTVESRSLFYTAAITSTYFLGAFWRFQNGRFIQKRLRGSEKLKLILFGMSVVPACSLILSQTFLNRSLDNYCQDHGLIKKYRIEELDEVLK